MLSQRLIVILSLFTLLTSHIFARRAPHMQFDIAVQKPLKFTPLKGTIECSTDSFFTTSDTMRKRFFAIEKMGENYETGWCEILPTSAFYPDIHSFWRVTLYFANDSLTSNAFKISNGYPALSMDISNNGVTIHEEFLSRHRGRYYYFLALIWASIAKILCFGMFLGLTGFTFKAFTRYALLSVLLAACYFAMARLLEWWVIFIGVGFGLFIIECWLVKKYIIPQRKTWVIVLAITLCAAIAISAGFFKIALLDFAE